MRLRFLGTGTSTGVPQIGCQCETCRSEDYRDKRMRTSVLVKAENGTNLLIDCGPDFYQQMLAANSPHLDGLLITHSHYDHVGGIDDLRPFCAKGPFPIYCQKDVATDLRNRVPYCFAQHPYPGVPTFDIHLIKPFEFFKVSNINVLPLPVKHYKLDILGFKIGNLGYITDCKEMPNKTISALKNVDTLVINALRRQPHLSHINLEEALQLIRTIKPRQAFLIHLSHQMGKHAITEQNLPEGVQIAFDGEEIYIPD